MTDFAAVNPNSGVRMHREVAMDVHISPVLLCFTILADLPPRPLSPPRSLPPPYPRSSDEQHLLSFPPIPAEMPGTLLLTHRLEAMLSTWSINALPVDLVSTAIEALRALL